MAKNDNEITSQDILTLVEAKTKGSNVTYTDIFKTIDGIRPNYSVEMWKVFWIPIIIFIASVVGMLFIPQNTAWHRLSLIAFAISNCVGCKILAKYEKKWWWVLFLDAFILYVSFSEKLSWEGLIELIQKIM